MNEEENLSQKLSDSDNLTAVKIISYLPNEVVLDVQTTGSQLLFLSDTNYPGWKALIDGLETKIYRANYAFRAVIVPAGSHRVVFVYQPASFALGVKITIISIVAAILFALWLSKKKFHSEK